MAELNRSAACFDQRARSSRTSPSKPGTDSIAFTTARPSGNESCLQTAEIKRQQQEHGHLGGKGLGAGDADLGTGVKIDAAVGLACDGAADGIDDRQCRVPAALCLIEARPGCRPSRPTD